MEIMERKLSNEMAAPAKVTISWVTQIQNTLYGELQKGALRPTAVGDMMSKKIQHYES